MRLRVFFALLLLLVSTSLFGAIDAVLPTQAHPGARVVLTGSGLDAPGITVTFAGSGGRTAAAIVVRTAALLECIVPADAVTGNVIAQEGGVTLLNATFTVTPYPDIAGVATLVRSANAHDVLHEPSGIAVTASGHVYVADTRHDQVKVFSPAGALLQTVGSLKEPRGLAVDPSTGDVIIADTGNHAIRRLTAAGVLSTVAGGRGPGDDDGASARFKLPSAVAVDAQGVITVADTGNHKIRQITAAGTVTIAGTGTPGYRDGTPAQFHGPSGVWVRDGGEILVADTLNHAVRAIANGVVRTVAGTTHPGYLDGVLAVAELKSPSGITVRDDGTIVVADSGNDRIRAIGTDVRTLAIDALKQPSAVSLRGALFIADSGNDAVIVAYFRPALRAIHPATGVPEGGTAVRLLGSGFTPDSTVLFGTAAAASVTFVSSTELIAIAPAGSGTVSVQVTTPAGAVTLASAFSYLSPIPPSISSFSPAVGFPGTAVTIIGANFETSAALNEVDFNGTRGVVTSASATTLVALVPAGASSGPIHVRTRSGLATSTQFFIVPVLTSLTVAPSAVNLGLNAEAQFTATARFSDGSTRDVTSSATWESSDPSIVAIDASGLATTLAGGTAIITARWETAAATAQVTVQNNGPIPDPTTTATPIDGTVVTDFAESTRFLYAGPRPVQTGVAAGAIDEKRVAVLRGRVVGMDDQPIEGVRVTVVDHPELGSTGTRADGMFDLAVNAGGPVTIRYAKDGFIAADRRVVTQWLRFFVVEDVTLVALDSAVTRIDLSSPEVQVARGSAVSDADGTRRATLVVLPGTTASMVLADGTTRALPELSVRATEYTVGPNGQKAMPAPLPLQSGYTYCVELSADEAIAAEAVSVTFSQPVAFYVENFLGFPVGGRVPTGYYDRQKATWVASNDGRIIKILTVTGDSVTLDITGDNVADDATSLGVTAGELQRLASLYTAGTTLWRVAIPHFTPWDHNWPYTLPPDAIAPASVPTIGPAIPTAQNVTEPCQQPGSIIDCHNQSLGERLPIAGTPFTINYTSRRQIGPRATVRVTLSGASMPASAKRIDSEVIIAGRVYAQKDSVGTNRVREITWDGKDAYGRRVSGSQPLTVRIGYVYPAVYAEPGTFSQSFGAASVSGATLGPNRQRMEITIWNEWSGEIELWDERARGFGGWTLDAHHVWDPRVNVLQLGNGRRRDNVASGGLTTAMVTPTFTRRNFERIKAAPDGTFYAVEDVITGSNNHHSVIWKINADGLLTRIAGVATGTYADGPASTAYLGSGVKFAGIGSDGSLYITNIPGRLRRIRNGIITTIAGGNYDTAGDGEGLPAKTAYGQFAEAALAPDGTIYVVETYPVNRVRRIDAAGRLWTVANFGSTYLLDIGVAADGTVYVASDLGGAARIRPSIHRITSDGRKVLVAGGQPHGHGGDGGSALLARLGLVSDVRIAADGSIYFKDDQLLNGFFIRRIRKVTNNGIMLTVAGPGGPVTPQIIDVATSISPWGGIDLGGDGYVHFMAFRDFHQAVVRLGQGNAVLSEGESYVASDGGDELYVFDNGGRHLRTVNASLGHVVYTFGYDPAGRLTSITDRNGNVTTIERSGDTPTAIVSAFGHRTTLAVDGNGYLSNITDPANSSWSFTSDAGGLMQTMTDPRRGVHRYTFDGDGFLIRDENPGGGFKTLTRTTNDTLTRVTVETALGRRTEFEIKKLASGSTERRGVIPGLFATTEVWSSTATRTKQRPDGTTAERSSTADVRFGMASPLLKSSSRTPGGIISSGEMSRSTNLSPDDDPLSATDIIEIANINGGGWLRRYRPEQGTALLQTAAGRQSNLTFDARGRTVTRSVNGLASMSAVYDAKGNVQSLTQAGRAMTFTYDARGNVETMTDPLQRVLRFAYDGVGRVTRQTLHDQRQLAFAYDAAGNVTSITPPGRPAHTFSYTPNNRLETYTAPAVNGAAPVTRYRYNADDQFESIARADGTTVSFTYDAFGRLSGWSGGTASAGYTYDSAGRTATITTPLLTTTNTYDGRFLITRSMSGIVPGTVGFTWGRNNRVASETVNGGHSVTFAYDGDLLPTRAGSLTLTRATSSGRLAGTTLGSVTDTYSYNTLGEVSSYSASFGTTPLLSLTFARDNGGRISSLTEVQNGITTVRDFVYDASGRLQEAKWNGTSVRYEYDTHDNRVKRTAGSVSDTATYDAQDRVTAYAGAAYTHTAAGDLATKTDASGTTRYTHTVGALTKVELPNGTVIEYVIDADGRRVGRKVDGTLTHGWLYSNPIRIAAELDGSGNVVARFVYGSRPNIPDYAIRGSATYRILSDHLGSPRVIVDVATGTVVESFTWDEFGNQLSGPPASAIIPFGYGGGLYDPATGLVRFGTRDYDPGIGRWTTKDPLSFGGGDTNLYNYAWNDPVNFNDPPGLWGFGGSISEATEVGTNVFGAGQQGSVGFGHFASVEKIVEGEWQDVHTMGAFASWGGIAYGGNDVASYPNPDCPGVIFGAYGGGGGNVWLTNADTVKDLEGPFRTFTINAAWGLKAFSVQYAWGKNAEGETIGMFSYGLNGAGGGFGASISLYDTNTWTWGPW